jgi:hypothetical protein
VQWGQDSSQGVIRGGSPRNGDSIPDRGKLFSSSSKCSNRLWNPLTLLCNGLRSSSSDVKQQLSEANCSLLNYELTIVFPIPLCLYVKLRLMTRTTFISRAYEGQSKNSRNSLTPTVWCTISPHHPNRVLLCRFCRGSGATSGRQGQWFLHHDNAPSHISLVVSPNHRTLRISLLPTLKMVPKGTRFATMGISNGLRRLDCGGFQQKPSVGTPTEAGSMEPVCVCARTLLWRCLAKRCRTSYH